MKTIKQVKQERKEFFKEIESITTLKINDNNIHLLKELAVDNKKLTELLDKYYKFYRPIYQVYDPNEKNYENLDSIAECEKYILYNNKPNILINTFKKRFTILAKPLTCEWEFTVYVYLNYDGELETFIIIETYGDGLSYDELFDEIKNFKYYNEKE